ncbi:conserved hypothetical protein [uncultured Stenotrophomonas sp.]|uniref:Uroporphyrin-III C-methyltransferase n=1 Tax=uncultured Stenotrophomonas sp. TaxID=165438 RepID=A0A1Y5Q514_9GAMM|nr:conserved hypothetical protein [uncultured Stenotrophomonas sp.]
MIIHCKRAYEAASAEDGQRFLVDRLWPRGVSHEQLQAQWLKDVAPSTELRQWFDHRAERWDAFRQRYQKELAAQPQVLAPLRDALEAGPVTLVYGARDTEHNQAVALRDYLLSHPRRST